MWNAAPSPKCHLCVNGAFAKIIKCLKYINVWGKRSEKMRKKISVCTYNIGEIEWAMRRSSSSKQIQSLLMPAKMLCARLMPPLTLIAVPFSRWWVWVAVYRSLNTGFECNIYHGLASIKCASFRFSFGEYLLAKLNKITSARITQQIIWIQTTKIPKQYSDIRKAQRRNVQKPFLIHKFQNGLSYLILK